MHEQISALLTTPPVRLPYSVHSTSGFNPAFPPDKIRVDSPADDNSRWTSPTPEERKKERRAHALATKGPSGRPQDGSTPPPLGKGDSEWVLIELDQVSLVSAVGFGKTIKAHPCNLAEFSIFGGLSPEASSMEPLVKGGFLKNDVNTERFALPVELESSGGDSIVFPIKYLRVDCHEAANASYSVSIWHLFLEGRVLAPPLDSVALHSFEHHQESTTAHLILAHLRKSGPKTLSAFDSYLSTLPSSISSTFEHPALSKLHRALVIEADFDRTEKLLEECLEGDLFREWSSSSATTRPRPASFRKKGTTIAKWERLDTAVPANSDRPGPRGGHQMVRIGRKLLLFGGWDGQRDLGDLWEWELPRDNMHGGGDDGGWRCLSTGEEEGGAHERPGKRSCHQLAVDESEGWVYLLGARRDDEVPEDWEDRVSDSERGRESLDAMELEGGAGPEGVEHSGVRASDGRTRGDRWRSDFWRFKAVGPGRGKWELLSADTRNEGGPALLFDHAMVVHAATQRLFVFGGKWQPYEGGDAEEANGTPATSAPTSQYSGMYCYDIQSRRWTHIFGDPASTSTPASFLTDRLIPRAGHSMVLDAAARNATIYIYGGQRDTRYENDLWAVRLATPRAADSSLEDDSRDEAADDAEEVDRLWRQGAVLDAPRRAVARSLIDASLLPVSPESSPSRNSSTPTIVQIRRIFHQNDATSIAPPAAFTPRLSLAANGSLTVLTGLTRIGSGSSMEEAPLEGIWRKARGESGPWEKIEEWSAGSGRDEERKPASRFASQVVFDPLRNEHYVFGGHPRDTSLPDARLSDFWKLKIIDPTPEEALRKTRFLVRKQRFNEMCSTAPTLVALQYLQNDLSSVVDHSSPSESTAFRSCMTALLSAPPSHNVDVSLDGSGELPKLENGAPHGGGQQLYRERHQLFEELMEFFPKSERQPTDKLDQIGRLIRRTT